MMMAEFLFLEAISSIFPLFVDRFGRYLWFFYLEFDKEAILMVLGDKVAVSVGGFDFWVILNS